MQRKVYAGDFRKVPWLEIRRLELEKLSGRMVGRLTRFRQARERALLELEATIQGTGVGVGVKITGIKLNG